MRVERIGIVGAGTMGSGIAQLACLGGYRTRIHDPDPAALEAGQNQVGTSLAKGAERERWSAEEAEAASELLRATVSLADLAGSDLVIEAAPEDLKLKRKLFASLAGVCGPEAILATNTSSLPVSEIGADVLYPERLVGMHFFNPPVLMKLVEVVAAERSSDAALATATEVAEQMGRTPIRAKDTPGFVANRLARPFALESLRMLGDEVADVETIDRIVRLGGGFRMGPFELIDLIGLDVNLEIARSFFAQSGELERWRPSPIQEKLVAEGRLGRKSSRGYYLYGEGHERELDPELGILAPTLDPEKLARIDPAAEEVLSRLFAQIANEAAFAREEDVASPEDMDTATVLGLNWPKGAIGISKLIGPRRALDVLEELKAGKGEAYRPAPLLRAEAEQVAS